MSNADGEAVSRHCFDLLVINTTCKAHLISFNKTKKIDLHFNRPIEFGRTYKLPSLNLHFSKFICVNIN